MLNEDISDIRKERHHITQEDFTPNEIVNEMLDKLPDIAYEDFDKIYQEKIEMNGGFEKRYIGFFQDEQPAQSDSQPEEIK